MPDCVRIVPRTARVSLLWLAANLKWLARAISRPAWQLSSRGSLAGWLAGWLDAWLDAWRRRWRPLSRPRVIAGERLASVYHRSTHRWLDTKFWQARARRHRGALERNTISGGTPETPGASKRAILFAPRKPVGGAPSSGGNLSSGVRNIDYDLACLIDAAGVPPVASPSSPASHW